MVTDTFPARFGRYTLLERIAAGGMAEVFLAKATGAADFQRLVAIKCMLPHLHGREHFASMFIDEAKLASQLNHANIVHIYDLGRLGQRLYISMEFVHGSDVRDVVRTARRQGMQVPLGFAAYVISKAAQGLDSAHRQKGADGHLLGLVHRDVSPQNILVSFDGQVKVVDFGIAKAKIRGGDSTDEGVIKGKIAYMAPEQVTAVEIDWRADIYALGLVLYELLSGEPLNVAANDFLLLDRVRRGELPDLSRALPAHCASMLPILRRALAREPADRFASASEMASALEATLIQGDSVFGAKQATEVMQILYGNAIEASEARLRRLLHPPDLVEPDDAPTDGHGASLSTMQLDPEVDVRSLLPDVDRPRQGVRRLRAVIAAAALTVVGVATGLGWALTHRTPPTPGPVVPTAAAPAPAVDARHAEAVRPEPPAAEPAGKPGLDSPRPPVVFSHAPDPDGASPSPGPAASIPANEERGSKAEAAPHPVSAGKHYGWLSLRCVSYAHARMLVDGAEITAASPALRKLLVGAHEVKCVEVGTDRSNGATVHITAHHTRGAPRAAVF